MFIPAADAVVAHRYRLVEEIGRGGMGSVWKAIDTELDAPCALKFILDQQAKPKRVRTRFLREARAAAQLQSPHVVSVRSVGEWDEALYISMGLLSGETLAQRLKRSGTLTPKETLRVVRQIALVLAMAHRAGIVHRDLKPENIWLWSGADLFVKVLDFGVAKHLGPRGGLANTNTNTGVLIGTPFYMSPEQAAGDRDVDHRVDLWALAVIAVQCLSGRLPFNSAGLGQLLSDIINRRCPPLSELYPEATPALEAWWQRATAADPDARYLSAESLAFNLALALELESVPAQSGRSSELPSPPRHARPSAPPPLSANSAATQEVNAGFDAWRKLSTKTTSGQPVTADVIAIPLTTFVSSPHRKVALAVGSLVVAGAVWQLTVNNHSTTTAPAVALETFGPSGAQVVAVPGQGANPTSASAPVLASPQRSPHSGSTPGFAPITSHTTEVVPPSGPSAAPLANRELDAARASNASQTAPQVEKPSPTAVFPSRAPTIVVPTPRSAALPHSTARPNTPPAPHTKGGQLNPRIGF